MRFEFLGILRNLLDLVICYFNLIFQSGDFGAHGHPCDAGDSIEYPHSCESGASGESDKNG